MTYNICALLIFVSYVLVALVSAWLVRRSLSNTASGRHPHREFFTLMFMLVTTPVLWPVWLFFPVIPFMGVYVSLMQCIFDGR
jgi:hypothetical protein